MKPVTGSATSEMAYDAAAKNPKIRSPKSRSITPKNPTPTSKRKSATCQTGLIV
jgi:hypothetical protein